MKIGLQLYNFRNELKQDFKGTLRKIAALGVKGVEFAVNYGKIPPDELAICLHELGLECAGTMFKVDALLNPDDIAYEYAKKLCSPAVTVSMMCDFTKDYKVVVEQCRRIGVNAAKHGLVFSYHNHWAEFDTLDGVPAIYRILDSLNPSEVFVEPDICWLARAGIPFDRFIQRYRARIRQIHMKDIRIPDNPLTTTELGSGVVDLVGAYKAVSKTHCIWMIYEQDNCADPFKSAEISLDYLKTLSERSQPFSHSEYVFSLPPDKQPARTNQKDLQFP